MTVATIILPKLTGQDRRRIEHDLAPRSDNGEAQLARILDSRGIAWEYEPFEYDLGGLGFRPDFWLPASRRWPELHIEVTWADRALGRAKSAQAAAECLGRKRWKIAETKRRYGICTVLITHREICRISKRYSHLDQLVYSALLR